MATIGFDTISEVEGTRAIYAFPTASKTIDKASFISFYDVTEKVAIMVGIVSFGVIDRIPNMRSAIIALIGFFALGAAILASAIRMRKRLAAA